MEYKITALTLAEMQDLIDDGTFSSCFTSTLPQLSHATKPTYNWDHLSDDLKNDEQMIGEIKMAFINSQGWDSHRIQKITEKPSGGLERIVSLRVGYYGATQPWIAAEEDQSTYYWAHIELMRKNAAGSKSWIYDTDYLKVEGPFYQSLGATKWHCLMTAGTDYIDACNTQASLRLDADPFKTPTWSDQDITYNDYDNVVAHNAEASAEFQIDTSLFTDVDVTTSWKKLEFDI